MPEPRQSCDYVLHHAVGEVFLLGIATHVLEWQNGDRWLGGEGRRDLARGPIYAHTIDTYRPRNVFQCLLASILESDIESSLGVLLHAARYADPIRLGQALQTRRYIHAIAKNIVTVDDDVTNVDAHAELDPLLLRHVGVALDHTALHLEGATHCVHHTGKFHQQPIASSLNNPPAVLIDLGIE